MFLEVGAAQDTCAGGVGQGTLTIGTPAHTLVCFYANRLAIREATVGLKLTAVAAMCNQSGSSLHFDTFGIPGKLLLITIPTLS